MIGRRMANIIKRFARHRDDMRLAKFQCVRGLDAKWKLLRCPTEYCLPNRSAELVSDRFSSISLAIRLGLAPRRPSHSTDGSSKSTRTPMVLSPFIDMVAGVLLILWFLGYVYLDPKSHLASFCGNAIADWSGSLVIILGTKFLYERGSAQSRRLRGRNPNRAIELLREHSLLIFIGATGIGWALLFLRMNPGSKWGQVVGNIVSEWVQMGGLVFLTKRLIEIGSKES
jgi:hypothetical protein